MAIAANYKFTSKLFYFTLLVTIMLLICKSVNTYKYAFTGAIFELMWLPLIATTFVFPIVHFIFWAKNNYQMKSYPFASLLLAVANILVLIFYK